MQFVETARIKTRVFQHSERLDIEKNICLMQFEPNDNYYFEPDMHFVTTIYSNVEMLVK